MDERNNTQSRSGMGWRCGTCGRPITRIEDGRVEWLACLDERGDTRIKAVRLVHANTADSSAPGGCQYDARREFQNGGSVVEGLPLQRFVGADGLMLLLSLLAAEEMPRNELLELAKRVQIPGYELTHELFDEAIADGAYTPSIAPGYYLQSEIWALFRWANQEVKSA